MTHVVAGLGAALQLPSVLVLWVALLIRCPSVLRSPSQRGVWLAVASATAAMTFNLPSVTALATRMSDAGPVAVVRNVLGVLSAWAVLDFVAQVATGIRWLRAVFAVAICHVVVVLLALDLTAGTHLRISLPATGPPAPSFDYWLALIGTHLTANTVCALMCWRYSGPSAGRSLALSLRLFGLGTAVVGVYWLGYLLRLCFGYPGLMPWLPLLMGLHGLLRAAAILVPTFFTLRRTLADVSTAWRLWPLWHDLVTAVPHVALSKPRHRLLDALWPRVPYQMLAYRRVIETRDAILALNDYAHPSLVPAVRGHMTRAGVPAAELDAAVLAGVIKNARHVKLAGGPAHPAPVDLGGADTRDLEGEQALLLQVARVYAAAPLCVPEG
ncbi:hypothetical protein PUR71_14840 [Streptomyces sp. SP17BM10]|uniref:MAB_1171c family putative transporter n=1 Tax=Streptomyces sp. SP17BM10 TaxID=3002530 RepID=UPI002E75B621|nr:MAB_1171c family putative transporter [Streptomyces sp. SP17BM10]MEE1784164.1 hypothetical protein [Streptomyces sp. SP17BM10]